MITDIASFIKEYQVDQCSTGLTWMLEQFKNLQPRVYLEIGCGCAMTFSLFHERLPDDGLAIGVDLNKYKQWNPYRCKDLPCEFRLINGSSIEKRIIDQVKGTLGDRQVDFLFIDGNHDYDFVRADWDNYSPLVRPGGLVFFHDWDPVAVARDKATVGQGAAMVCFELEKEGYVIQHVPVTSVGTAFVVKK